MQAIASFNAAYADRSGRIAYFYNARVPVRAPGYDWGGIVPGDTSETLWTEYLPFDAMPRVVDPPSGFVQNCNSSPFETTLGAGNPQPDAFPASAGIETRMTNRSLRALELLGADDRRSRTRRCSAIKFDVTYSERSELFGYLERAARRGRCRRGERERARDERRRAAARVEPPRRCERSRHLARDADDPAGGRGAPRIRAHPSRIRTRACARR